MDFFLFDPRPGKENPAVDVGIEVTVPALKGLCEVDIDPQHGSNGKPVPAACAVVHERLESEDPGLVLAKTVGTVRLDADSLTAFALLEKGIFGVDPFLVVSISRIDGLGPNAGEMPREHSEVFSALSRLALADKRPLAEKILLASEILRGGGKEFIYQALAERAEQKKQLLATARVDRHESFVVVEATLPGVFDYEAFETDVIVAINPAFRFQNGEPHRKVSIARRSEHIPFPIREVLEDLQEIEPGWGGGANIIGSPQGEECVVFTETIIKIVTDHVRCTCGWLDQSHYCYAGVFPDDECITHVGGPVTPPPIGQQGLNWAYIEACPNCYKYAPRCKK
ncbi:hypothetical protein A2739_03045 [Candidatus Giovannonibacteria bacterium RIFCSPHIGHO2_01_FULL_43_100]|uniref:Uncharacterized protein n=1 Tax=Candidatus Giovannonibacteria bacterium RIFCSPHIGHO2_12_FULL_43_15 TaxID=1798341 RepID=A0A1F5WP89_9BACT|nr:MAG: hypothetical protein A2739_03045 [Candidatus Giovannonibacteria bacterium RIFCSPHIGHO2_01_FULL_43_100]OGF66693.1 MAG: hypothetical protein A3B97_02135 [Candidatus Giovannonibacteria bacterium RIFCSPHIGHO2_02_FULL_43_32]OGF77469.1 MAG: hypothetical protein A3F23_00630 [Candidatus Giovannonibacteria bacterium RIFCSPHIGHO2_12_FULL_43_15]